MTDRLQQETTALLARIRPGTKPPEPVAATDYDFAHPCGFTRDKLVRLDELGEKLAAQACKALEELLRDKMTMLARPVVQRFGPQAVKSVSELRGYGVALLADGKACGYLWLTAAVASGWVAKLLGAGQSAGGTDRDLSSLESALLQDIQGSLVAGIAAAVPSFKGLKLDATVLRELPAQEPDDSREFCEFGMSLEKDTPPAVALLLHTSSVAALIEPPATKRTAEDFRKDLQRHLERVRIRSSVWLGQASLMVRDLIALEPGDVLLLNRLAGEPVQLVVEGTTIASGLPARSDGQYALQVMSRAN